MRGGERQVKEEGLIQAALTQPTDCAFSEQVREIAFAVEARLVLKEWLLPTSFVGLLVSVVVGRAPENAEELLETLPRGEELLPVAEVPLAEQGGVVAGFGEQGGKIGIGGRQAKLAAGLEPGPSSSLAIQRRCRSYP